jgi:hypothetical protein
MMTTEFLTKVQKQRVQQALEDDDAIQKLKSAKELHQFILHYNWDDGLEPMLWTIQQPYCDKGTALLIYWLANPENQDEIIQEIEDRYTSNYYSQQNFYFNPKDDEGEDHTQRLSEEIRKLVPPMMFELTPGIVVEIEDLYEIIVRDITPPEYQLIQKHVSMGLGLLYKRDKQLNETSSPEAIVNAIKEVVDEYRSTNSFDSNISADDPLLNLGWVWVQQLCRAYGWNWIVEDSEYKQRFGAVSPHLTYITFPPYLVKFHLEVQLTPNKINEVFNQLDQAEERKPVLSEAYMNGWLYLNPYK